MGGWHTNTKQGRQNEGTKNVKKKILDGKWFTSAGTQVKEEWEKRQKWKYLLKSRADSIHWKWNGFAGDKENRYASTILAIKQHNRDTRE